MSTSLITSAKSVFSGTSTRNQNSCNGEISQGPRNFDSSSISIFQTSFHDYQNHRNCRNCGLISCRSTIFKEKSMIQVAKRSMILSKWYACGWSSFCLFQTKHVTPYIHILVSHVPDFLRKYGSLAPFSQQGLEKLNDDLTKSFFSGTNHHDQNALQQMLQKLNHIEELTTVAE